MDNFDMSKYFDDFFAAHTGAGESIDDIMASFTDAANRALIAQKAAEEEKRKAEAAAKLAEQKKEYKRNDFTGVMDTFMDFMLEYEYITNDEYDQFWKDWNTETCDELLDSLDEIKNLADKFSDDLDFFADLFGCLGAPAEKKSEDKDNVQSEKTEKKAQAPVKKNPVIKVKLPNPESFIDILNGFINK